MFKPDIYVEHVSHIKYDILKDDGIKLLVFDLDNTLDVPDRITTEILEDVDKTLNTIEKLGFEILIMSNNTLKGRVSSFCDLRNYNYIEGARKPFLKQYKKSSIINSYQKDEICFIGDKLVTDIVGGNRFKCKTILVDTIQEESNEWYTGIMTFSENLFANLIGFKRGEYYGQE